MTSSNLLVAKCWLAELAYLLAVTFLIKNKKDNEGCGKRSLHLK